MIVASVNICSQKILKTLLEESIQVPYKDDLAAVENKGYFSESIQKRGLSALRELKKRAAIFHPEKYIAVATSAMRNAKNGEETIQSFKKNLGIHTFIISQEKEAQLGYMAAYSQLKEKHHEILVWDIGGGSMQITSYLEDNQWDIYLGKLASVPMRHFVLATLQKRGLHETPNPIGSRISSEAIKFASTYAKLHISSSMQKKLKKRKVYGIGGVHYYSLRNQIPGHPKRIELKQLEKALSIQQNKKDSEINSISEYAKGDVTNILLVTAFMKAMSIKKIHLLKINMAHGVLTLPEYWN